MRWWWTAAALLACSNGKDSPSPTAPADACQRFVDTTLAAFKRTTMPGVDGALARGPAIESCRKDASLRDTTTFACVLAASTDAVVRDCFLTPPRPRNPEVEPDEPRAQLERIASGVRAFHATNGVLPGGIVFLAPGIACCEHAGGLCRSAECWGHPLWMSIGFKLELPHRFQYTYKSEGDDAAPTRVVATAVGDPACDGKVVTYSLELRVVDGKVTSTIEGPLPGR